MRKETLMGYERPRILEMQELNGHVVYKVWVAASLFL